MGACRVDVSGWGQPRMAPVLSASAWFMLAQGVVGPRIDTRRPPSWPVRDGRGRGSGVAATSTRRSWYIRPTLTTWCPVGRRWRTSRSFRWLLGTGGTMEQVATMTDEEILALYREKRKNPYLTLSTAKALHGLELKFGYLRRREQERQNPEAGWRLPSCAPCWR